MKLASYKDGSRDGQLVVVSRDHSLALHAGGIVGRLQQLLDDWNFYAPQLQDLAHSLDHGKARHAFAFDPAMCLAPLPRIARVVSAAAYPGALARQARARGLEAPAATAEAPLRLRSGDLGLGARQALALRSVDAGLDFEAHWALVTGAIAAEATPGQALDGVRLVGLANAWALRADASGTAAGLELPLAWAPLLVTLDELGAAWQRGRLAARLVLRVNGAKVARLLSEDGQAVSAGELLARLARERPITAGTVLTLGPVGGAEAAEGCASRLELLADGGEPGWLAEGDTVELEAFDATGQSLFGALEQTVVRRD